MVTVAGVGAGVGVATGVGAALAMEGAGEALAAVAPLAAAAGLGFDAVPVPVPGRRKPALTARVTIAPATARPPAVSTWRRDQRGGSHEACGCWAPAVAYRMWTSCAG